MPANAEHSSIKPQTPQHGLELPTPPLTGGFDEQVHLFESVEDRQTSGRSDAFKHFDHSFHAGLVHVSDNDSNNTASSTIDHGYGQKTASVGNGVDIIQGHTSPNNLESATRPALIADHSPVERPFDFLGLPHVVRNQIYRLLVTVVALICVRQKRTRTYNEAHAYLFAEHRELLPGIAYALTHSSVDDFKLPFCYGEFVNAAILRVCKQVHLEARGIMYGSNQFELQNLNKETSPRIDYRVPLFPYKYQSLISNITIRAYSIYGFQYMIKDRGWNDLKRAYRSLQTLTLVLELESPNKGYGRKLARVKGEYWVAYVWRVHRILQLELFGCPGLTKSIPIWINLKVLFVDDQYIHDNSSEDLRVVDSALDELNLKQQHLKSGVAEAFELFKKGRRE